MLGKIVWTDCMTCGFCKKEEVLPDQMGLSYAVPAAAEIPASCPADAAFFASLFLLSVLAVQLRSQPLSAVLLPANHNSGPALQHQACVL